MLEYTVFVPQRAATVTVSRAGSQGPQGIQGIQGLPGEGVPVVGESPTGTRDGVNAVFTTANSYQGTTLAVYRNGLRQSRGSAYTETTATTFTFSNPPFADDEIVIDYVIA